MSGRGRTPPCPLNRLAHKSGGDTHQQQPRRFSRPYEQVFDVDALAAYLSTARPEDVALSDCLEDNPVRFGEGNVARVVLVSRVPEWLQTIEVVPTWDSVRTHKLSSNTATVSSPK